MGYIKLGSQVDGFLQLGTKVFCKLVKLTHGNQTVISKLK